MNIDRPRFAFTTTTFTCILTLCLVVAAGDASAQRSNSKIDFALDVQPILRLHCFRCHGTKNQEAGLQLNRRSAALNENESIITPHASQTSLLIQRIVDQDMGDIMPLDGNPLTQKEIDTLRQWIDQGAVWPDQHADAKHWAYEKVRSVEPPLIKKTNDTNISAIDRFVLRRLDREGLEPSPPLPRPQLIRRVSLALVGLPPSPAEVDAFINDPSPDAYEKVVDRLLRSDRYGERWAVPWLDLARYADSNGFQADQIRDNWAYRDWVIRSFNNDLPFNEFVTDQIAGDLRPDATIDQKIATGFHRMTTCNVEAGVHPEANRTNQIVDRVNTTATVFLGTTLECAQCHDHKYDPFSQADYYRLFAYFNNTPLEVKNTSGVTWDFVGPKMDLPMDNDRRLRHETLTAELASLRKQRSKRKNATEADFQAWLTNLRKSVQRNPSTKETAAPILTANNDDDKKLDTKNLAGSSNEHWRPATPTEFRSSAGEDFEIQDDGAVLLTGSVPDTVEHTFCFRLGDLANNDQQITAIRIELLTDERVPGKGPGRGDAKRSNVILSELTCELKLPERSPANRKKSRKAAATTTLISLHDASADFSQAKWEVEKAIDGNRKTGWAIAPEFGKPHWASFVFEDPISTQDADATLEINLGQFFGRGRTAAKPRVSFFNGDPMLLSLGEEIQQLAALEKPTQKQLKIMRTAFEQHDVRIESLDRKIKAIRNDLDSLNPDTTLVMVEMDSPRETFVMIRGEYENLGDQVQPGVPALFDALQSSHKIPDGGGNRMDLANWLTSSDNPLLARVTVNRWWAELFGQGLVRTSEDFGTQSQSPSHPELLDYLATELIASNWSMKSVHQRMVMSSTFQQSSRRTPKLAQIDPENRLLTRGPRIRLPAEMIRDNGLAISGLLSTKMFGPPIMPYQPDNIWRSVGRNQPKWIAAKDENRFRRGLYVVCKRAAPYPSFINFDAPDRGNCTVRRGRTNTPLQALTLLNDPAYAEMALAMADRVLHEAVGTNDTDRLTFAMQLAIARSPSSSEIEILQRLLDQERKRLNSNKDLIELRTTRPIQCMKLHTDNQQELAAWFAVANAILNLDETISQ